MDREQLAIRAAKGNNGGEWETHYTEEQKQYWRDFVDELMKLAPSTIYDYRLGFEAGVAAECERCAKVLEMYAETAPGGNCRIWMRNAVSAIRKGE